MIEDKLFLIDSNILICSIDSSEKIKSLSTKAYEEIEIPKIRLNEAYPIRIGSKQGIAKNLLKPCWLGKKVYAISLQNLSEFFVNSTKKVTRPLSKEKGAKIVKRIIEFDGFKKLEPTKGTLQKAIDICIKENIGYWDALIAATMIENNIYHIYTENTKDFEIEGITAVNPFENRRENRERVN